MIYLAIAAALALGAYACWRCYCVGVRHGVHAMYRETMATLQADTERTKLRLAGLVARIDTHNAIQRAIKGPE